MRPWLPILFALSLMFSVFGSAEATSSTHITLNPPVHVLDSDGTSVVLGPGTYNVELAADDQLRFLPTGGGGAVVVTAMETAHEETITEPEILSFTEEGVFRIMLLLPDGRAVHTEASLSKIRERGLRRVSAPTIKKQRRTKPPGGKKVETKRVPGAPGQPYGDRPDATEFDRTMSRKESILIGAASFSPNSQTVIQSDQWHRSGHSLRATKPSGVGRSYVNLFTAPVQLPDGARVVELAALFEGSHNGMGASVTLAESLIYNYNGKIKPENRVLATVSSGPTPPNDSWISTTSSISPHAVIDNRSSWYYLHASPAFRETGKEGRKGIKLLVVRIDYLIAK